MASIRSCSVTASTSGRGRQAAARPLRVQRPAGALRRRATMRAAAAAPAAGVYHLGLDFGTSGARVTVIDGALAACAGQLPACSRCMGAQELQRC